MMSINLSDIAILNIKGFDCRCIISLISKIEAINLMQNAYLTEISRTLLNLKNLFLYIKLGKEILTVDIIKIEKQKIFYGNKTPIFWGDIEKVLLSNKISFDEKGYKCFICYLYDDNKVKPLNIILPETSAYVKSYDGQIEWMKFLIEDYDILEKCNTVWDKVSTDFKNEFDSKPLYNKEIWKTKIKSHGDVVTDFYEKKSPN